MNGYFTYCLHFSKPSICLRSSLPIGDSAVIKPSMFITLESQKHGGFSYVSNTLRKVEMVREGTKHGGFAYASKL